MKLIPTLALLGSLITLPLAAAPAPAKNQSPAEKLALSDLDSRMQWFNHDRFGMFIHWGLYSTLGGEWKGKKVKGYAEWIQASADIPSAEYAPIAKNFNPAQYDPEKWVVAAKNAGMKYIVITTKHHEGFCLWPSDVTTFDVADATPFKRDILKELSAACKKHGIKFGTYYSIIDWHHPSQMPTPGVKGHWKKWGNPTMKPGQKKVYVDYMKAQIKELITRYDSDILWFDGDWTGWWTPEDGDDLYRYIRGIKPSIIINNRVSKRRKFKYDYGTPENVTPGKALDYYWEACWTMNHTWGYSKHDHRWKSDRVLIQKLVDIASKGGNLLLNVGPKGDGTIQPEAYNGLKALGDWMKVNGESIYGSKVCPMAPPANTRVTAHGEKTIYLHLFAPYTQKSIDLPIAASKATATSLLTGASVPITLASDKLSLDLRKLKQSDTVTTLKIEMPEGYATQKADKIHLKKGDVLLSYTNAKILGKGSLRIDEKNQSLGFWTNLTQGAQWEREVVTSGKFELILLYSLEASHGKGTVKVTTQSGKEFTQRLKPTQGWGDFKELSMGEISLTAFQPETITVAGVARAKGAKKPIALMNLRGVILRPVSSAKK